MKIRLGSEKDWKGRRVIKKFGKCNLKEGEKKEKEWWQGLCMPSVQSSRCGMLRFDGQVLKPESNCEGRVLEVR